MNKKPKIWIDLTNSPHINFFKPFINTWQSSNYELVITCRDLANTISLIEQNGWAYFEVGKHAGKNILNKIIYFPQRVIKLWLFLRKVKPTVGISHSSFYSPLVCKLLGIPSVYINDNEHAKGNYIAFRFATKILIPEFLKEKAQALSWHKKYNIDFYPGIKEGVYLSQSAFDQKSSNPEEKKTIYIRLEPWSAQYYKAKHNFLDEILEQFKNEYTVKLLPRSKEQIDYYKSNRFANIIVQESVLSINEIYEQCSIFIGAGGSMTREMAYLGIPTISVYQDKLLEVDKYLIERGFMAYCPNVSKNCIDIILEKNASNDNSELAQKGSEAFSLILKIVDDYAKN